MDTIEAETPLKADWGEVLLDGRGNVIGILDGHESAEGGTMALFVPASLALGVAEELDDARPPRRARLDRGQRTGRAGRWQAPS